MLTKNKQQRTLALLLDTMKTLDNLKLPNVCRHLLNNPDFLNDPMYRKQVTEAIKHDESHWDLERVGRSLEQESFLYFVKAAADVAARLRTMDSKEASQCFTDLDKASEIMAGAPIAELEGRLPEWMKSRTEQAKTWQYYYSNPLDRVLGGTDLPIS